MKNTILLFAFLFSTSLLSQTTPTTVGSLIINNTPATSTTNTKMLVRNPLTKRVEEQSISSSSNNGSYKGTWNAATNTPTLTNGVGETGSYYLVTASGTSLSYDFRVNDKVWYDGVIWRKDQFFHGLQSVLDKFEIAQYNSGNDSYSFLPGYTSWSHYDLNTNQESGIYSEAGRFDLGSQTVIGSNTFVNQLQYNDVDFTGSRFLFNKLVGGSVVNNATLYLNENGVGLNTSPVTNNANTAYFKTSNLTANRTREIADADGKELININGYTANAFGRANIPLANGTDIGLSTNDFTNAEKTKLAGLTSGVSPFDGQYSSLTGIPSTFIPSAHSHDINDVTNLQSTIDAKVANDLTASTTVAPSKTAVNIALALKQNALTGTGFVRSTAGVISYDNNNYITGINNSDVTTALGFTPYNSSNPNGYISTVPAQSFSSLTGKPTTLSGYGITDAYPLTGNPSGFITTETNANALKIANNLSDLNNVATARTNLGLGTLATSSATIPTNTNQLTNGAGFIATETDPVVKAINGIVRSNGTTISAAVAGTDYATPNSNTTGTASNITATSNSTITTLPNLSINQSQVTGLVTELNDKASLSLDNDFDGNNTFVNTTVSNNASFSNIANFNGSANFSSASTVNFNGESFFNSAVKFGINNLKTVNLIGEVSNSVNALPSSSGTLTNENSFKTVNGNSIVGSGDITISGGGGGISAIGVTTANGISGTSSGGTTPNLTISLGAITPSSVNGVAFSGTSTPALAVTGTSSVSGINTGDNAANTNYANDYRAANFVAGTNYLAPNGSAANLTNFPILNQNTTGNSAGFTGSLAGEVTGTQGATTVSNAAVISKLLTGYTSGAGTILATDNILQAVQKLNGNIELKGNSINVQIFTTSGTWTEPIGAKYVEVKCIAAGGSGGSGRKGAATSIRCGGGGGASGGVSIRTFNAADLTSTVTVTVPTSTNGGASQTTNSSNGNSGTSGGNASFGQYLRALGGGGGNAGTATSGSGGSVGNGLTYNGVAGANASTTGGNGSSSGANAYASAAGGGGGGITNANVASSGGSGNIVSTFSNATGLTTNAGGVNTAGGNGATPTISEMGFGGGGGGASITGNAGNGGNGSGFGSGGGGGGAALDGVGNSGAGGNGSPGLVVVTTYF
jgi:hypothetical protein